MLDTVDQRAVSRAFVVTHRDPAALGDAVPTLVSAASAAGVKLVTAAADGERHQALATGAQVVADDQAIDVARTCDLVIVLAGDGTLLRALNRMAAGPPVLGINFGIVGYLAGCDPEMLTAALAALSEGHYRTVRLPVLEASVGGQKISAINDVVASGGVTGRIIEVGWSITAVGAPEAPDYRKLTGEAPPNGVDRMGVVPCDGMVIATPVGSTGYNLSNGGPVLAWGVDAQVVSFIAPHTLSARPLVIDQGHAVTIEHMGRGAPLQVLADGDQVARLDPGCRMRVETGGREATLALVDNDSFFERFRRTFGRQLQRFDPDLVSADDDAARDGHTS